MFTYNHKYSNYTQIILKINKLSLKQYRELLLEYVSYKIGDLDDFDKEYIGYASIALYNYHYQTKEYVSTSATRKV